MLARLARWLSGAPAVVDHRDDRWQMTCAERARLLNRGPCTVEDHAQLVHTVARLRRRLAEVEAQRDAALEQLHADRRATRTRSQEAA